MRTLIGGFIWGFDLPHNIASPTNIYLWFLLVRYYSTKFATSQPLFVGSGCCGLRLFKWEFIVIVCMPCARVGEPSAIVSAAVSFDLGSSRPYSREWSCSMKGRSSIFIPKSISRFQQPNSSKFHRNSPTPGRVMIILLIYVISIFLLPMTILLFHITRPTN